MPFYETKGNRGGFSFRMKSRLTVYFAGIDVDPVTLDEEAIAIPLYVVGQPCGVEVRRRGERGEGDLVDGLGGEETQEQAERADDEEQDLHDHPTEQ